MKHMAFAILAATSIVAGAVYAHGGDKPRTAAGPVKPATEVTAFGRPGDPSKVNRTLSIGMSDQMRFSPAKLAVKKGETIRFVATNQGKVLHEMVLGTDAELRRHAELMRKFPDMEHDEAYMTHVKPGATGAIVWTFDKPGTFSFACLIPGHFEAGMLGTVTVQ